MTKINGLPINKFSIVIPNEPDETVLTALAELVQYIEKACGCVLPVINEKKCAAYEIVLGKCNREIQAYDLISRLKKPDGFVIISQDNRLLICGKESMGTLFGVYYFLEEILGVIWLTSQVETVNPVTDNIVADVVYEFSCESRICNAYHVFNEKFRARCRLHYTIGDTNKKLAYGNLKGIEYAFEWGKFGHTFDILVPYDKYFSDHPEYFSFAPNRFGAKGMFQLCMTNDNVFKIALNTIFEYLKTHPDCKIVSVSQNDSFCDWENNYCMCDNCRTIFERENNYSAVNLYFVNRIAAEVEKRYPNVLIHTLAYGYTRKPPAHIKPRNNVIIQYCLTMPFNRCIGDSDALSMEEKKDIDKWFELTDNLYVWMYWCNFTFYFPPLSNLKSLYYNTIYFLKKGVYGIFQQTIGDDFPFEFYELRTFLIVKLFQKPNMCYAEYNRYIELFVCGYYGKSSAPYITGYLKFLNDYVEGFEPKRENRNESFYMLGNADFISKGECFWKKALDVAENDIFRKRIVNSKISFDFCRLMMLHNQVAEGAVDTEVYQAEHKRILSHAYSYRGKLIYSESSQPIEDISNLDFALPPFQIKNKTRQILLRENIFSDFYHSNASTNKNITDFSFEFRIKKEETMLIFEIKVKDKDSTHTLSNMNDWEQDSVEIFFSETLHKSKNILDGDFSLRINADGRFAEFGSQNRIVYCNLRKDVDGYSIDLSVNMSAKLKDKIGFELIANNFGDSGYINTVYWNSLSGAAMTLYPYTVGELIFIE